MNLYKGPRCGAFPENDIRLSRGANAGFIHLNPKSLFSVSSDHPPILTWRCFLVRPKVPSRRADGAFIVRIASRFKTRLEAGQVYRVRAPTDV